MPAAPLLLVYCESKVKRPWGCVCGLVSVDVMCRESPPNLSECWFTSHDSLSESWKVVPMRIALVKPGEPVRRKPGT